MTGQSNLFSRFGFQVGPDGKIDNYTRGFFSKFTGRVGPAIPDLATDASWPQVAATTNGLINEFVAQGWIQKGFEADETSFASAIQAVTMIPAATEWGYAPYEVLRDEPRRASNSWRRKTPTASTTARSGSSSIARP